MTSFRVIIISFFCLILVGSLLLMLPISSRQRCVTSFPDAMFTAVSATVSYTHLTLPTNREV